jgi:hypothetical protein
MSRVIEAMVKCDLDYASSTGLIRQGRVAADETLLHDCAPNGGAIDAC